MTAFTITGQVLWPGAGFAPGTVHVDDGVIQDLRPGADRSADLAAPAGGYVVPGFIDLQVNGAFGADLSSDPGAVGRVAAG